jgi:hypothetical protein
MGQDLFLSDSLHTTDINKEGWSDKESSGKRWIRRNTTDEGDFYTFTLTYNNILVSTRSCFS